MIEKTIINAKALFEIIALLLVASVPEFIIKYVFGGLKDIPIEGNLLIYFSIVAFLPIYLVFIVLKSGLFFNHIYKTALLRRIIVIWLVFTGLFGFLYFYLYVDVVLNFPEGTMYFGLIAPKSLMSGFFFMALAHKIKTNQIS